MNGFIMTQTTRREPESSHPIPLASAAFVVNCLEVIDNWMHIVVAIFFILMATTAVVHMAFTFVHQLPLVAPGSVTHMAAPKGSAPPVVGALGATTQGERTNATLGTEASLATADPFVASSLELLSLILFVVILLELLRTIITYLQTHDTQAIMQEFLVVGIISCVRKILLVGAQSSLEGTKGMEFVQEATGVVIDIFGILLLIGGLIMLKRAATNRPAPHTALPAPPHPAEPSAPVA